MRYVSSIRISLLLSAALVLSGAGELAALPVDLTAGEAYVRKGFTLELVDPEPAEIEGAGWIKIEPGLNGQRHLRVPELGFEDLPKHSYLSWKTHPPESFTFVLPFEIDQAVADDPEPLAVFFAIIGVNWEVYLNGRLLKSEVHRDQDGKIVRERNARSILVPLDARALRGGRNVLTLHIVGDPTDVNTGLFRTGPYLVGRHVELSKLQTNLYSTVLLFLYFFVGIFHLLMFLRRPEGQHNLWFGFFAILLFAYNFLKSAVANDYFPDTYYIHRLEIACFFLLAPTLGAFLNTILKDTIGRFTLFVWAYTVLFILAIAFAPMPFVEDVLNAWLLLTLVVPLPFYLVRVVIRFLHEIRKGLVRQKDEDLALLSGGGLRAASQALLNSIPGNLFIGAIILAICASGEILDNLYWHTGLSLIKYGFFFFVAGTTLSIANRFLNIQKKVEIQSRSLERRVNELDDANKQITRSSEEYRLLVEGTADIIFATDLDSKLIRVNKAIQKQLGIKPDRALGTPLTDLVWYDPRKPDSERRLLEEQLSNFLKEKRPITMKLNLKSAFNDEPREFQIRLEYLDTGQHQEVVGHAQSVLEDSLLKYFISERQKFEIGNYLVTGEEMTQRLIRNLEKYLDAGEVAGIRVSLREIIINAIEHGNLAVTYDEKTQAQLEDRYREFIRERQEDPRYANRKVRIEYMLDPDKVVYKIEDEGDGFDVEKMLAKKASQVNEEALQHGRGIMMTEEIFDEMKYNKKGNAVLLTKYFGDQKSE